MNKIGLGQTKILLAILLVLAGIGGFQVWKYQQAQYQKFVDLQKRACQNDLYSAAQKVKANYILYSIYRVELGNLTNHDREKYKTIVKKPGINSPFEAGKTYLLIYQDSTPLIPDNPRYEGKFFSDLSKKPDKYNPPPLTVVGKSLQGKQATVTTPCSVEPITVSVDNLYETVQEKPNINTSPVRVY